MRQVYTSASCANRFGHKLNFSQGQFSYHFRPWSSLGISKTRNFAKRLPLAPSMTCQKNSFRSWMMRVRSALISLLSTLRTVLRNMRDRVVVPVLHRIVKV